MQVCFVFSYTGAFFVFVCKLMFFFCKGEGFFFLRLDMCFCVCRLVCVSYVGSVVCFIYRCVFFLCVVYDAVCMRMYVWCVYDAGVVVVSFT